ncbi:MAG TPA: hypothetical protein VGP13_02670, partial [Candidatus Paceibacterota bacterium]|nr:hypothetical protein [Candidatus Paceibacterota bacterium]
AGDKLFCKHADALEGLFLESPTHVLVDFDGMCMEMGGKGLEIAQVVLRDLQQSASADQKVFVSSFFPYRDIGGELDAKNFLRMPYTARELEATLTGAG